MAHAKAPSFDPSRVPPARRREATYHSNRSITVEEAHELLWIAWTAFDRARADPPAGTILRDHACTERCANCRLECAVILSSLQMAYRDYQDALAAAGHDPRRRDGGSAVRYTARI